MQIATDVLAVLDRARTDGPGLTLIGQLDRNLYTRTNKVLEAAGGKWNRAAKAHIFERDAADVMEQIILTGEITRPQDFGYYPSPPSVVHRLLTLADLKPGLEVLEPSAGRGAIAGPVAALGCHVDCVELLRDNALAISDANIGRDLTVADFLTLTPHPGYDRVVMNPPFAKQDDVRHVLHAHQFLKPGGLLVAVMSNGVTFRTGPLMGEFNALLARVGGSLEALPEGSFKASGTGVNTVIAVLPNP